MDEGAHGSEESMIFGRQICGMETVRVGVANEISGHLTGNEAGIVYLPRRDWDRHSRLLGSISKAETLLGYKPNTSFMEGIKHTEQWFRDNWDDIESLDLAAPVRP